MTLRPLYFILLTMLLTWPGNTLAQRFRCTELPNQTLLPVPQMGRVLEDAEGYMWYGTQGGGVCRDDGYRLKIWNSRQPGCKAIESDEVTALAESADGRIWVGTRSGLYFIDKRQETIRSVAIDDVQHKKIHCLAPRADGALWVGVERQVVLISPALKVLKRFTVGENDRQEPKNLMIDHEGTLWICILRGGLCSIDKDGQQLTPRPWTLDKAANYMVEDTLHHCYWVGTWGGGIVSYPDMTVQPGTLHTDGKSLFGCEVNNMVIDPKRGLMWSSTVDNLYAYRIVSVLGTDNRHIATLIPMPTADFMPQEKKIIGDVALDRHGNLWVPGQLPHTFIISEETGGGIRRDAVPAMTEQIGYKLMVSRIVREGAYYWIYQDRTRLSLYNSQTGELAFMANAARPETISTNKALARRKGTKGVWTCRGRRLIYAWNEGMTIHWREEAGVELPDYITALNDPGKGELLIGTKKQVFSYNYQTHQLQQLTDSVGFVQSVGRDPKGELTYTTRAGQLLPLTDRHGHTWTLTETTLTETSSRTGASRIIRPTDQGVEMEHFTDFSLSGDSICLGGVGAFCMVGHSKALDQAHAEGNTIVLVDDGHLSTLNPLQAPTTRFAYRFADDEEWIYLPPGDNRIDYSTLSSGSYTLEVKATDRFGRWSQPRQIHTFRKGIPSRWLWLIALTALTLGGWWYWRRRQQEKAKAAAREAEEAAMKARMEALKTEAEQLKTQAETLKTEAESLKSEAETLKTKAQVAKKAEEVPPHPLLQRVTELIHKNIDKAEYSVEDLCTDLGISRMNLYRKFQTLADQTPSEFIRTVRLQRGAELLLRTDLSVSEIAYAVGFTSPQYFTKCFKEDYGMTPKKYQTEHSPYMNK